MKKKLLSLVMATAMILSLAVPAFAAGTNYWEPQTATTDQASQEIIFAAKTFVPTIKLTMPNITTDPMVLNPYKIDYAGTTATINGTVTVNPANYADQVICPVYNIKNETDAKMKVKVATSTTATGVTMVSDHVDITESGKKALLQFVVGKTGVAAANLEANSNGAVYGRLDPYDLANNSVVTLNASTTTATEVATLASAVSGTTTTANYLQFQFSGELSRQPNTAWTASDTVSTTVTFTFSPISGTDTTGTNSAYAVAGTKIPFAAQSAGKDIILPKIQNSAIVAGGVTSSDLTTADQLNATDPKWDIVDAGALADTETVVSGGANAPKLTIGKGALNLLPKDGNDHVYDVVLSYVDKNEVPRTMKLGITMARAAS